MGTHRVARFSLACGFLVLFLSADLADDPNWDFSLPETFHAIASLCVEGLVDVWLAGPPCSTVSRLRHLCVKGGPRPVRSRSRPWGLRDLSPHELSRVTEANTLWINTMAVAEMVSSRGGGHLIEHPGDPEEEPYPSIWILPEMINMEARTGATRAHTHQCP